MNTSSSVWIYLWNVRKSKQSLVAESKSEFHGYIALATKRHFGKFGVGRNDLHFNFDSG